MAKVPTEHEEQAFLIRRAWFERGKYPKLQLMFAVPNGGLRNKVVARKLKLEGLKAGVPDLILPVARGGYFGLYLEMKRLKGSTTAAEQKEWHAALQEEGYKVMVCKGAEVAWFELLEYLKMPKTDFKPV